MVREGIPFVLIPVVLAALLGVLGWWPLVVAFAAVALFMMYFFRDPQRTVPTGEGLIVSAADGRVTRIEEKGDTKLVSVFLSPLDVHINRSPITGIIKQIDYIPGRKMPATNDEASLVNERNSLLIEGVGITVTCTQIAGILARRIVCWPKTGDNLARGQKFGLIKFSSRTDLTMPSSVDLQVKVGDRVKGGETVIAKLH
ncbi:MAG: phosphatidylserine decarboxylase [Acidobacteria bacterium]|nr:phosphatidylserine decarboxylase [Acidobacteriota bacterium]MBK9527157.1 phosphatidylserine decarboxylase [Acidobacteriota bacterium]MBP7474546.1 phosphatidylserine decarboxylase [Pyrinomonadaceae bacterium]MBP9110098.1 phosphatidylserine decarboxylase [Pyrinomonadaceae bacterium]